MPRVKSGPCVVGWIEDVFLDGPYAPVCRTDETASLAGGKGIRWHGVADVVETVDGQTEAWTGLRLCRTILRIARGRLRPCPVALCVW